MSLKPLDPQEINEKLYKHRWIHDALPGIENLRDEDYLHYRTQGFIAVSDILSAAEVSESSDAIVRIIFNPDTQAKVQFTKPQRELKNDTERELAVRKVYEFVGHDEQLRAMAYHPNILSIVEKLLGGKAKLVQDMALLKPPTGGGEKPWHQDMAYGPLAFHQAVVGVWIALDAAGLDNGCMHVIPRSQMSGAVPHYAVRDWQLCDEAVPVERDVAVPLAPGGALFFHGLLFHGTPNNTSDKRRRALQFHYALETSDKMSPQEYKRVFTNELTGAEC
ncbi:phytanoyl-CoA dioxygenase family protein [Cohnella sp. GCM10020058]|uniref:phytanoyl-CoA dioxygenase family protein n=1 Tax=Cohnella sp. GCM10020058 TaxID=3317330 RepID=UPI0036338499